jgi:predicted dienelactone hydrolase
MISIIFRHCLFICLILLFNGFVKADTQALMIAGAMTMKATVPARGEAIDFTLWYPASSGGTAVMIGDSPVFKGTPAMLDAPIENGLFPVVVLAHGGLRASRNLGAWIAADLATRGYIVMHVHAPTLGQNQGQTAARELWLRPSDISAALNTIKQDAIIARHMAPGKIGMVGFLRGGTSALALAGARIDAEIYKRSCDVIEFGIDCAWFKKNNVDLRTLDNEQVGRDHFDSRIKIVVAIDPELSQTFTTTSLQAVKIPVQIISLGQSDTAKPILHAAGLEKVIPQARYETVPEATSFSAFSLCTAKGAAILIAEDDNDVICKDGGKRSREEIHIQIIELISKTLKQEFLLLP